MEKLERKAARILDADIPMLLDDMRVSLAMANLFDHRPPLAIAAERQRPCLIQWPRFCISHPSKVRAHGETERISR